MNNEMKEEEEEITSTTNNNSMEESPFSFSKPITIFREETLLGKGAFGSVWKIVEKRKISKSPTSEGEEATAEAATTEMKIAIKKPNPNKFILQVQLREIGCLILLKDKSPYVISIQGTDLNINNEGSLVANIYFPLAEMDLNQWINQERLNKNVQIGESLFDYDLFMYYTRQLCSGLYTIHNYGIIHRDIKPENILCYKNEEDDHQWIMKISDFGSAKPYTQFDFNLPDDHTSGMVPAFFRSPEIFLGGGYNTSIDVWAMGCVLFILSFNYDGNVFFNREKYTASEHLKFIFSLYNLDWNDVPKYWPEIKHYPWWDEFFFLDDDGDDSNDCNFNNNDFILTSKTTTTSLIVPRIDFHKMHNSLTIIQEGDIKILEICEQFLQLIPKNRTDMNSFLLFSPTTSKRNRFNTLKLQPNLMITKKEVYKIKDLATILNEIIKGNIKLLGNDHLPSSIIHKLLHTTILLENIQNDNENPISFPPIWVAYYLASHLCLQYPIDMKDVCQFFFSIHGIDDSDNKEKRVKKFRNQVHSLLIQKNYNLLSISSADYFENVLTSLFPPIEDNNDSSSLTITTETIVDNNYQERQWFLCTSRILFLYTLLLPKKLRSNQTNLVWGMGYIIWLCATSPNSPITQLRSRRVLNIIKNLPFSSSSKTFLSGFVNYYLSSLPDECLPLLNLFHTYFQSSTGLNFNIIIEFLNNDSSHFS